MVRPGSISISFWKIEQTKKRKACAKAMSEVMIFGGPPAASLMEVRQQHLLMALAVVCKIRPYTSDFASFFYLKELFGLF